VGHQYAATAITASGTSITSHRFDFHGLPPLRQWPSRRRADCRFLKNLPAGSVHCIGGLYGWPSRRYRRVDHKLISAITNRIATAMMTRR
jgi:hypothetical protein